MFFEFQGDFSEFGSAVYIWFPGIRPEVSYRIEDIEEARSFVGASVCICNSSSTNFAFTDCTGALIGDKFSFASIQVSSGQIINMNCVAAKGDNDEEVIGWTYVRCNQATARE